MSKRYGLILSDKGNKPQPPSFQATRNVFGNDSDSDDGITRKPVLLKPSDNINRQAKIAQEKAISEDPTVYQYDEIYDDVISKKEQEKAKSKEIKKPQYIENLIKSANKRKIENERRVERQIQKEREKEGDEFQDKEVFVTSAYKKKLEEMRLEEEKEKREEYLESIGDVTKQKDLGGFYRHLYEQKLGSDKTPQLKEVKSEEEQYYSATEEKNNEKNSNMESKKRNYRKRKLSSDNNKLSEGEIDDTDEEINRMNLEDIRLAKRNKQNTENIDADSDFSVNDPSDDETDERKVKEKEPKKIEKAPQQTDTPPDQSSKKENPTPVEQANNETITPKIDIWKKRTVGEVFDQALKRYYERKAARGS